MIRIGDRQQFATVRAFLESNYAEDSNDLADRVGDFDPTKHQDEPALVRMLFLGRAISIPDWESVAPHEIRILFSDLGLTEPASEGRIRSGVLLYRMRGIYIASDRFTSDEGQVGRPAEDCVYYALTDTAHYYLHSLPTSRYGQALDLGCGSGVAALFLASNAQRVYATDIAPRCILFTEFNRMLNGVENVVIREGSLYEPVDGLTFDLITCHPPFDISLSSKKYIYADGGEDGEFVTRGVVAGLPKMLNPGGQFVGAIRATDRKDGLIEERMRQWMGDAQSEFDIAVIVRSAIKPEEHAISASMLAKQNVRLSELHGFVHRLGRSAHAVRPRVNRAQGEGNASHHTAANREALHVRRHGSHSVVGTREAFHQSRGRKARALAAHGTKGASQV